MSEEKTICIIGAGYMAKEHYKALKQFNVKILVFGRGEEKARLFEQETGEKVIIGDYVTNIEKLERVPEYAIVAVNLKGLSSVTKDLISLGIKNIIVEKPVSHSYEEIDSLNRYAKMNHANVYVAYNRRYYASVDKALQIIKEDDGVTSFNFEFTEWTHVIEKLEKPDNEKKIWFYGNSTHVLDLAFFLGGRPREFNSYVKGGLSWHPDGCVYAGAGITEDNALFSYQANWNAPGRWGVEILTNKHRLYFRPLEQLQIQDIGSVKVNPVEIDDKYDVECKPGLYKMLESFLYDIEDGKRLKLEDHLCNWSIYEKIAGKK